MRLVRLNLSALRTRRLPPVPRAGFSAIEFLDTESQLAFTRREMLGMAGIAAASLPLKFGGPQRHLQFIPGKKSVTFKLDGSERWSIDTRRFAGRPTLQTKHLRNDILITLTNARYPGTNLPADMECELTRVVTGWNMRVKMALGDFDAQAPFERWLRNEASARSIVNLDESVEVLRETSLLRIAGRAQARLQPNWTLRLRGKGIARLSGFGGTTVSDSLVIALLTPEEPSLMRRVSERRSLLAMNRAGRSWPFEPILGPRHSATLAASSNAFDRIRIEASEDSSGTFSNALVAESLGEKAEIAFVPPGNLWAGNSAPLRLPLRNARYAIVGDSLRQQAALVARYPREPIWVHAKGCSFEVGDSEDAPAFEAVSQNGQPPRIRCAPSLKRIAAPLPGVVIEAGAVEEGMQLAFLAEPRPQENRINAGQIHAGKVIRRKVEKKRKKKEKTKPKLRMEEPKVLMRIQPKKTKKHQSAPVKVYGEVVPATNETSPRSPVKVQKTVPKIQIEHPRTALQTEPGTPERAPQTPVNVEKAPPPLHRGGAGVILQTKTGKKKKKVVAQALLPSRPHPSFSFNFIRPDDLLALRFEFYNMTISAGGASPSLVRIHPNQPTYMVIQFWPQHVAEEAFQEGNTPKPLGPEAETPVTSRVAGPSRLAFIIPDSVAEIPYTVESLLDWAKYEQSVTSLATPPKPPTFLTSGTSSRAANATAEPKVSVVQNSSAYYQGIENSLNLPKASPKTRKVVNQNPAAIEQGRFAGGQLTQFAQIKEPDVFQTSLEVPYQIILSPNYYAGWAHSTNPVKHGDRVELWHTRLGVRSKQGGVDEENPFYRTVRAVWATDYQAGCIPPPHSKDSAFNTPTIDKKDRYQIVRLSSDPTIVYKADHGDAHYVPQPIQVNRLMLSTMGAWLDSNGTWDLENEIVEPACKEGQFRFDLKNWRHIAAMGRDQYVRIVHIGFLFPTGHKALFTEITERKFDRTPDGKTVGAYLRKQYFVVPIEHEKDYPAVGQPHPNGPQIPFQTIRIHTLSTPALDTPKPILDGSDTFWPLVDGQDFQFKMSGVDWEGNTSEFTTPLIFLDNTDMARAGEIAGKYNTEYITGIESRRRIRPFFGQKIAYAKHKVPGDTTFETDSIVFRSDLPAKGSSIPQGLPHFYPGIDLSKVRIATIEQLTGVVATTAIKYHNAYLAHGFDSPANKGQVFAELLDPVPLLFGGSGAGSDKVGALLTPSMTISGLSRLLGPVGGTGYSLNKEDKALDTIASGAFDPKQFFKVALDAKLLGGITLAEVIKGVTDFSEELHKVPKFITERNGDEIATSFTWQPDIQNVSLKSNYLPYFIVHSSSTTPPLTVKATLTKTLGKLATKPPSYSVSATLNNFEIRFVPTDSNNSTLTDVLHVGFNKVSFESINGQKPDVKVDISGIEFSGPLTFINELKNWMPPGQGGFVDPPSLDITPQGVELGYSLGLPPIGFGVFSLTNVSLAAQLNIYFTGDPMTFQFDFCQEEHPFMLTVSLFGGGGYFGLTLSPKGIERIAAELEFGGSFSLDIGVASGGIYLTAGISYSYTEASHETKLGGYLRCGGAVEVLGLITVSVEFKMELNYDTAGDRVWGTATLTVEISVLFFSKSVDLTVQRTFAGKSATASALEGAGTPYPLGATSVTFSDEMNAADWQIYCEAFA
jgi:hypothetical protein